jgi:hypothetical protein
MSGPDVLLARQATTRLCRVLYQLAHAGTLSELRLYCEGDDCPARTIEIALKATQGALIERFRRQVPRCPICHRATLSVHEVLTLEQSEARDDRAARESVNTQMWQRDHAVDDDPWSRAVPVTVLLDDRLPPTPEGWFA